MKVRRESLQTRSETGTRRREALRHTHAVCRRTERRDCSSQPCLRVCSRKFMNHAGQLSVRRLRRNLGQESFYFDMSEDDVGLPLKGLVVTPFETVTFL